MVDPLELFWPAVDAVEPVFAADHAEAWPPGAIDQLIDAGLICQTAHAEHVTCPECIDCHMEEVIARDGLNDRCRFFIQCPEHLRVEIAPEQLFRWVIDFKVLTKVLAGSLSLRGRCTELVAGRLWRLGRTTWQGTSRDVLWARGLLWADSGDVVVRAGQATHPIVLVAAQVPDLGVWKGRIPPVVALSQMSQLRDGQVELDIPDIFAAIHGADAEQEAAARGEFDETKLKRMIR